MVSPVEVSRLEAVAEHFDELARLARGKGGDGHSVWPCLSGCGRAISRGDLCGDCLRLVAATLRAGAKAE